MEHNTLKRNKLCNDAEKIFRIFEGENENFQEFNCVRIGRDVTPLLHAFV